MPHDTRAYLADIIECREAITDAIAGLELTTYQGNRLFRSAVEREFIIIGEAMSALSRRAPNIFGTISRARRIVDFRNQLTHEYPTVDDAIVWAIADRDIPILRRECRAIMTGFESNGEGD
jgi:uncharacterized protein with HEPN domain